MEVTGQSYSGTAQHGTPWHGQGWRSVSPRRRQAWPKMPSKGRERGQAAAVNVPAPPPAPGCQKGKSGGKPEAGMTAAGSKSGAAESQLSALVAALSAHQEVLPEKVRDIMHLHQESSASAQAKALHKHIATQESASKQLAGLRSRRAQYLTSWKDYVVKLSQSLEQQLQEKADVLAGFDAEESTLLDTIETVKATVLSLAGKETAIAAERLWRRMPP